DACVTSLRGRCGTRQFSLQLRDTSTSATYPLSLHDALPIFLNDDMVVSTVMSNLGFYQALESLDIKSDKTKVGDRYVVEEMKAHNYNLGGEQSGHIIMLDHNTTGDGLLTGIHLAHIIKKSGKKLSELHSEMKKFPQELVNVKVEDKYHVTDNEKVKEIMAEVQEEMAGNGRILVRASGTEPL